ncbi:BTAD domain-containing putative transcriptional regulator [Saccharothrix sp. Mg75]|uniref:AfsR/SARP family transcriptional regulator n=1 Tax=Saccharothrix sp. Mg75 TaxID=3445357 RepID=UPI003EECD152
MVPTEPAVRLLGAVRVVRGGAAVEVSRPRQRAVLAVLALRVGRSVPVEELVRAVWGADAPSSALGNLYTYVSALRDLLGADGSTALLQHQGGYRLRLPEDNVDAAVFERLVARSRDQWARGDADGCLESLAEASALWGGTPLAGVAGPRAESERARLVALWGSARRLRAQALAASGRDREAVVECTALVRETPFDEEVVVLLASALGRSGRTAEALDELTALRRRLRDDLGVAPGPDADRLYRTLLDTGARPARPAPSHLPHRPWGFVGRADELARLRAPTAEPGAVVVVGGVPGSGASTLALEFAHRVAPRHPDGRLYADLRGDDADRAPWTTAQALDHLLRCLGVPDEDLPGRLEDKFGRLHAALTGRRVLVLLDNASSAEQVRELVRVRADAGTVLVTGPVPPGVAGVRLGGLDPSAAVELLTGERAPDGPALAVVELCGRLPAALRAARALLGRGADHPTADDLRRLARDLADEEARLDLLSVDGEPGVRERWARLFAGLSDGAAAALRALVEHDRPPGASAAGELVAASLVRVDGSGTHVVPAAVRAVARGLWREVHRS